MATMTAGVSRSEAASVRAVHEQLRAAIASGAAQPERLRALLTEIVEVILVDDHAATVRVKMPPFVHAGL